VCSEREEAMAKKAIIMMGILWNMAVLLATGFVGFIFLFFKFAFEMVWLANPFYSDRRFFRTHSSLPLVFVAPLQTQRLGSALGRDFRHRALL
jgi:hypothetical protein